MISDNFLNQLFLIPFAVQRRGYCTPALRTGFIPPISTVAGPTKNEKSKYTLDSLFFNYMIQFSRCKQRPWRDSLKVAHHWIRNYLKCSYAYFGRRILSVSYITANLYYICLSEHETLLTYEVQLDRGGDGHGLVVVRRLPYNIFITYPLVQVHGYRIIERLTQVWICIWMGVQITIATNIFLMTQYTSSRTKKYVSIWGRGGGEEH